MSTAADLWQIDLIVQVGDHGIPGRFPTRVRATSAMPAWAESLRQLRDHAALQGWGTEGYRVLSYGTYRKITDEREDR